MPGFFTNIFSYIPFSTLETLALQIYRTNPTQKTMQAIPTNYHFTQAPFKQIILERNKLAQSRVFKLLGVYSYRQDSSN